MTTEMTTDAATATTIYAEDIQWEDDGTGDIGIEFPKISIVQGTSKFKDSGKHGGEFWHSDREEYEGTLDVVPLFMASQRALFEEGENAPGCSSLDGRVPVPGGRIWRQESVKLRNMAEPVSIGLYAQPETCADCPFNEWGADGNPPPCKESILLLVEREDKSFAQLRFGGISLKPFRKILRSKLVFKNKRLPLFFHRFHLFTEEWTGGGNKAYRLQADVEQLPTDERAHYNDMVRAMRGHIDRATTVVDEPEAEAPSRERTVWNEE